MARSPNNIETAFGRTPSHAHAPSVETARFLSPRSSEPRQFAGSSVNVVRMAGPDTGGADVARQIARGEPVGSGSYVTLADIPRFFRWLDMSKTGRRTLGVVGTVVTIGALLALL